MKFIFLSSDQLFNRNTKSKKENAITKPINSKLKNNNKALILRTILVLYIKNHLAIG